MSKNDRDVVTALRARLAERVGADRFEVWFGPNAELQIGDGILTVVVPNQFYQDWLRNNFRKDLEAACQQTLGSQLDIEFRIEESEKVKPTKAVKAHQPKLDLVTAETVETNSTLPIRPRRKFNCLKSYVVGDSNRLAHQSALLAANQPGSMSPLFVYGPSGTGKSHLLEGIWSGLKRGGKHGTVLYLSAEQFTSYFQEALHGTGTPSFRRKYRAVGTLLIDDVQFFVGKKATILELLHTVDVLIRDGRQLVLAADRAPSALTALGPELTARIASGVVCKLDPPEFETRLGIVKTLAAQMELQIPADVIAYVAAQFTSHARELAGALKRLHAMSLAHDCPVTLRLAEESLADLIHHNGKLVKLSDIDRTICELLGLEDESLKSDRKGKEVSYPRMLAMWLARKHTRAALSEIGFYFGGRTHSTVISANKKIEAWIAAGMPLELSGRQWKLEELIRRAEESLRRG